MEAWGVISLSESQFLTNDWYVVVFTEPTQALGAENSKAQFVGRSLEPAGLSSLKWAVFLVAVVENMQNTLITSDVQILHAGVHMNQSEVQITNMDVYMNHFDQTFD